MRRALDRKDEGGIAKVLGDAKKVKFVPLSAKDRFTALQSGEVDILARNTTWTSSRDTSLGLKHWTKVRELTRVATRATEAAWM